MEPITEVRAADIMTTNIVTTSRISSIADAAALLVHYGISGMPVRDETGRIVGLISLRDIVRFERERSSNDEEDRAERDWTAPGAQGRWQMSHAPWGYHLEASSIAQVQDFMTPIVISLPRDASLDAIVDAMLDSHVHRVLVSGADGEIIGIISALDVLRALKQSLNRSAEPAAS